VTVSGWQDLSFGDGGFVTVAAEYADQDRTERGGWDFRQQYPLVNGTFDPREAAKDRFNAWYGEPELEQVSLSANAGCDLANGARLYGWAGYQDRDARSAGSLRQSTSPQGSRHAPRVIRSWPASPTPTATASTRRPKASTWW